MTRESEVEQGPVRRSHGKKGAAGNGSSLAALPRIFNKYFDHRDVVPCQAGVASLRTGEAHSIFVHVYRLDNRNLTISS